jgi:hypothetical protein
MPSSHRRLKSWEQWRSSGIHAMRFYNKAIWKGVYYAIAVLLTRLISVVKRFEDENPILQMEEIAAG